MKTVIAGVALAFCAALPLKAQEIKSPRPAPPPAERVDPGKKLDNEYHGPGAHCRTVLVRSHGVMKMVRECRDS
jgi:hypothetical protein